MLNEKKNIVTALSDVLPTYYELFVDSTVALPCITYIEDGSAATLVGDTIGYQSVGFLIKIWGKEISDMADDAQEVDGIMRGLGYKRNSYRELVVNGTICMIMGYVGLGRENFND